MRIKNYYLSLSKRIYIGRHAKSSWEHPNLSDHDRPLNSRGEKDAPFMARMMERLGTAPDLIISSSAKRALSTARAYQEIFFIPERNFWIDKRIYHANIDGITTVIQEIPEDYASVYLFGHNPTMHSIADHYIDIAKFSTAGILSLAVKTTWADFQFEQCDYLGFHSPKMLQR